jgi:hypothetical protein
MADAANRAQLEGRLQAMRRLDSNSGLVVDEIVGGKAFQIEVLGPVVDDLNTGGPCFKKFGDTGKTINGHSLVLKITFGDKTILFGGDLNSASEDHLMQSYNGNNPFEVDVAKSCHHGSADFREGFMALINPYATVISSGDNESHAHPRAEALGCAGRYTRGPRPLVFSTELARSTNLEKQKIVYGMINLRTDGNKILMAQMKESSQKADMWDSYHLP